MQTSAAAHCRTPTLPGDHSVGVFILGVLAGMVVGVLAADPPAPVPPPSPVRCVQMDPLAVEVPLP